MASDLEKLINKNNLERNNGDKNKRDNLIQMATGL